MGASSLGAGAAAAAVAGSPPRPGVDVSVVIAARNEAAAIGQVVGDLTAVLGRCGSFEIVVVSDGSDDATAALARAAGAVVLENERPLGYGAALKRGFRLSRGEAVVITDGDGTYPAAAVPEIVARLAAGADQVIGARTTAHARVPLLRRPVKWAIRQFASLLVGRPIPDLNSGLRGVRRGALNTVLRLLPDGFSCTTTLTVAGILEGWEVVWLPIDYHRRSGPSKFRPVRDTARLLLALLRAVVYFQPLRVLLPVTVAVGAVGLAFAAYDVLVVRNLTDKTVLANLAALELFVLALLADLFAKRYPR